MAGDRYRPIEQLDVFLTFEAVSDEVWDLVAHWNTFAKNTVGSQLVRAADSVGANLVEGDSRGSDPDSIRFFRYSRSSGRETRLWITRAIRRKLIDAEKGELLLAEIERGGSLLNGLIKFRRESHSGSIVKEEQASYSLSSLEATD